MVSAFVLHKRLDRPLKHHESLKPLQRGFCKGAEQDQMKMELLRLVMAFFSMNFTIGESAVTRNGFNKVNGYFSHIAIQREEVQANGMA